MGDIVLISNPTEDYYDSDEEYGDEEYYNE